MVNSNLLLTVCLPFPIRDLGNLGAEVFPTKRIPIWRRRLRGWNVYSAGSNGYRSALGLASVLLSASNRAGFALVAVIWSLGLITLLGTAVIVGSRYRSKVAASSASETAAAGAAESAINLGIVTALTASHEQDARFPIRCRMPDGAQVAVTLELEVGKVDLNTGRPEIIARLFAALTGRSFDRQPNCRSNYSVP